ncbi:MAG: tRNA dihydrouridine synthase DusB [Lachnospiraceae bacterium]|nr:tRNA dihydrouridine synthase DusB [Lachnospiraceae bacterium]
MNIGEVKLDSPYILAPMAGVSDLPFRRLCREMGAGLVCTEMISAKALHYGNKATKKLMAIHEKEHPIALQIFGSDPDIMAEQAAELEKEEFDILDINMGCPMPKIVNNGEGAALLRDIPLIGRIIEKVAKATKKPVTVKIRKGFYKDENVAAEVAKAAESAGAAAIHIHARTREQYYEGKADWSAIKEVKEAVSIPVIGNGDVRSFKDAERMFQETLCDAISVGRGAKGNPWIFKELISGEPALPAMEELKATMLRHLRLEIECKGEYTAVREMRKHLSWYTAGLPNSAKFRTLCCKAESAEEMCGLIDGIVTPSALK